MGPTGPLAVRFGGPPLPAVSPRGESLDRQRVTSVRVRVDGTETWGSDVRSILSHARDAGRNRMLSDYAQAIPADPGSQFRMMARLESRR
jgi:hypothetical protein